MRFIRYIALFVLLPACLHGQSSPAEAVAVLRASHSPIDLTDLHFSDGPTLVVIHSSPTAGPFGEFKPFPRSAPLSRGPYVFRAPAHLHAACSPGVGENGACSRTFDVRSPDAGKTRRTHRPRR